jgi:hypothetical protein
MGLSKMVGVFVSIHIFSLRIQKHVLRSIHKNGVNLVNDEGIRDTLLDLHNYAGMALMLLDE